MLPPLVKHSLKRGFTLLVTVVIAVYLTIIVANMGGYVDEIVKGELYL